MWLKRETEAIRDILFSPIATELEEVEERLRAGLESHSSLVAEVSSYVLGSGGKRIRPALLLLSAKLCGSENGSRSVALAAVAEYMHVASLIHDDIIDNADKRRGLPSANSRWGSHISVLVGDFLYARAIQILVEDGDFRVLKAFADATVSMAEGEILELETYKKLDITYEEYLRIITCKTAALISAACQVGALISKAPEEQVKAMADFGLNLGIGFQLVDDALDFVADEGRLGKPVGNDLKEGKITFPLIHLARNGSDGAQRRLRWLVEKEPFEEDDLLEVRRLVEEHQGVQATMEKVHEFLDKAKAALEIFPDSPSRRSLLSMTDFVRERDW